MFLMSVAWTAVDLYQEFSVHKSKDASFVITVLHVYVRSLDGISRIQWLCCARVDMQLYLRSNILTEPSDPTDANRSLPVPARVKAMSCTSLSCAISWVFTLPVTLPITWPVWKEKEEKERGREGRRSRRWGRRGGGRWRERGRWWNKERREMEGERKVVE